MRPLVALLFVVALAGCGGSGSPGPADFRTVPPEVRAFLVSQALPQAQQPVSRRVDADTLLFSIAFGKAQDCPSGCFYSGGVGLSHKGKVGWLAFANFDDPTGRDDRSKFYDVDAVFDAYLFSPEFSDSLKKATRPDQFAGNAYQPVYGYFLELLAGDADTPPDTLARIAQSLATGPQSHLAELLLGNPAVQRDRNVLTIIADLPPMILDQDGNDVYTYWRAQARALLGRL